MRSWLLGDTVYDHASSSARVARSIIARSFFRTPHDLVLVREEESPETVLTSPDCAAGGGSRLHLILLLPQ